MDVAYVSAISALAGSVIGGLTSGYTTWLTQRSQARAGMVAHDLARREDLIRDFIVAASKMYGDAMVNSEPKMPEIVDLYAMVDLHARPLPTAAPRSEGRSLYRRQQSAAGANLPTRCRRVIEAPHLSVGERRLSVSKLPKALRQRCARSGRRVPEQDRLGARSGTGSAAAGELH
jgi:hypothetical protein